MWSGGSVGVEWWVSRWISRCGVVGSEFCAVGWSVDVEWWGQ